MSDKPLERRPVRPFQFSLRNLLALTVVVAVVAALLASVPSWLTWAYNWQRIHVESIVASYDEIEGVRIEGADDVWYEVEYFEFSLAGKPDSIVGIHFPTSGRIDNGAELLLAKLGPWRLNCEGYGLVGHYDSTSMEPVESDFHFPYIDVDSEGAFANSIPFEVRSLGDIITHYDELVALFAKWPTKEEPGRVEDSSEKRLEYYVERTP